MKPLFAAAVLLMLAVASPARAADGATGAGSMSWGGVYQVAGNPASETHVTLWDRGNVYAGVAPAYSGMFGQQARGLRNGGFVAWQSEGYRLDAMVTPALDGSVVAGLEAAVGPRPGELGTSYGVRFGAAWIGDRFTVNPATSGMGLAEIVAPSSDVNLSFTVNHSLTPSLSIIGTAEARRNVGNLPDGNVQQHRFLFGAGLGYRF